MFAHPDPDYIPAYPQYMTMCVSCLTSNPHRPHPVLSLLYSHFIYLYYIFVIYIYVCIYIYMYIYIYIHLIYTYTLYIYILFDIPLWSHRWIFPPSHGFRRRETDGRIGSSLPWAGGWAPWHSAGSPGDISHATGSHWWEVPTIILGLFFGA